mgnify:CR=1 FL=1
MKTFTQFIESNLGMKRLKRLPSGTVDTRDTLSKGVDRMMRRGKKAHQSGKDIEPFVQNVMKIGPLQFKNEQGMR